MNGNCFLQEKNERVYKYSDCKKISEISTLPCRFIIRWIYMNQKLKTKITGFNLTTFIINR